MAKGKMVNVFYCQNCGHESSKWMGQCPGCKEWNTFVEETVSQASIKAGRTASTIGGGNSKPSTLSEIETTDEDKLRTGINELDRVLGGGIVAGSLGGWRSRYR